MAENRKGKPVTRGYVIATAVISSLLGVAAMIVGLKIYSGDGVSPIADVWSGVGVLLAAAIAGYIRLSGRIDQMSGRIDQIGKAQQESATDLAFIKGALSGKK